MSNEGRFALAGAFKALGDSMRRDILALLRTRGTCTAGEIARAFPKVSRPAVSRHLRVLREGRLVTVDGAGRERRYRLDTATIARLQRDWFAQFDALMVNTLANLKEMAKEERNAGRIQSRGARRAT